MKKIISGITLTLFWIITVSLFTFAQQTDTSSYFPLGFWGIWIDQSQPPFTTELNQTQWNQERSNWNDIKGNYVVSWTPMSIEDTLMKFCDENDYKMAVSNFNWQFGSMNTNSLIYWLRYRVLADSNNATNIITDVRDHYDGHSGFHSYYLDDEHPVYNSSKWPQVEFVANKIHTVDPTRKSYISSSIPVPSQTFFNTTPSLDIIQFDYYPFTTSYPETYSGQQSALDILTSYYNDLMNRLNGKHTEWQAIIQTQDDNITGWGAYRRPNFYELRVQAYLALSRGARGITSYVYGSRPTGSGYKVAGLVDVDIVSNTRQKYEQVHTSYPIPAFDNVKNLNLELVPIGSTIRKLRVYNAFPNTSIPANSAGISNVNGNKIEIGTFKRIDEGTDSTSYFMIVNRVCNNADGSVASPQTVTVTFSNSTSQEISEVVSGDTWVIAPNGSFIDILQPGSGKLYKIIPATYSTTRTIPAGVTLTVQAGATLKFASGKSMTVNGTLTAIGTAGSPITFDKSSYQNWSGIKFQSGSQGQLTHCLIKNANTGVTCTNSRPLIEYCDFDNNYYHIKGYYNYGSKQIIRDNEFFSSDDAGIYLYNCNVDCHGNELDGDDEDTDGIRVLYNTSASNTLIYDNSIFDGTNGIRLDHGTARIQDNNIYGNSGGIYATDYASPRLLDYDETGLNVIANNNTGIYISTTSEADLDYAWNTVAGNSSKNLTNNNSSVTTGARDNYWGADPPPTGKFYGNINYSPWSDEDNTGRYPIGFMKLASMDETSIISENEMINTDDKILSDKYNEALSLEHNGNFNKASELFNEVINLNPDHKLAVLALNHLICCIDKTDKNMTNTTVEQIIQKHSGKKVEGWALKYSAGNLVKSGQYSEAIAICKSIDTKFPKEIVGRNALHEEWIINNYVLNNNQEANTIIEKYEEKYGLDEYLIEMKLEAGLIDAETAKSLKAQYLPKQSQLSEETDMNTIPKSYNLFPNYPNPFNPSTNIRYSLPYNSSVELRIYDINGREIKSFNISSQSAGYQNIVWDGRNENGVKVSSGVYLYRISIKSLENHETFLKTAKLMMLK